MKMTDDMLPALPVLPDARHMQEGANIQRPDGTVTADDSMDFRLYEPVELAMFARAYGLACMRRGAVIALEEVSRRMGPAYEQRFVIGLRDEIDGQS